MVICKSNIFYMNTTAKESKESFTTAPAKKKWLTPSIIKLKIRSGLSASNTESEFLNPSAEDS